jgi:undecaprenyl-diphosphatase
MSSKSGWKKVFLFGFLCSVTAFRFYYILHGPLDLTPDEAYYWEWSRRLEAGYYSKGPVIACLIRAGTLLFGDTPLGVRFFAPVLSVLSSVFLYRVGSMLYDEETGIYAAGLLQIIPLFSVFGVLMTIDAPFVFFWVLGMMLFLRALTLRSLAEWMLAGIAIGLGLLTKFTMAFFYISALLYMIASRQDRQELLTPRPYIAFVISLVPLLPLVLWNLENGFVTFRSNMAHAQLGGGLQFTPGYLAGFIGSQAGAVTPVLFALLLYAAATQRREDRFSFWFFSPTFVFFLFKSAIGKVQANWAMAGYVSALLPFSAMYMKDFKYNKGAKKALVAAAVALCLLVSAAGHYPWAFRLPRKWDPTARLRGWKALAGEVDRVRDGMPGPYFIFSDTYQISAELAFYLKGHPVTYAETGSRRSQYDFWPGYYGLKRQNALFVTIGNSMPENLVRAFKRFEVRRVTVYDRGFVPLRQYSIFLCYGFKGMEPPKKESEG